MTFILQLIVGGAVMLGAALVAYFAKANQILAEQPNPRLAAARAAPKSQRELSQKRAQLLQAAPFLCMENHASQA